MHYSSRRRAATGGLKYAEYKRPLDDDGSGSSGPCVTVILKPEPQRRCPLDVDPRTI